MYLVYSYLSKWAHPMSLVLCLIRLFTLLGTLNGLPGTNAVALPWMVKSLRPTLSGANPPSSRWGCTTSLKSSLELQLA